MHRRVPDRFTPVGGATSQVPFSDYVHADVASDAYSLAIADAERLAASSVPFDELAEQEDDEPTEIND